MGITSEGRSNEEGWRALRGDGFYLEKIGGLKINGEGATYAGAEVKRNKRNKKKTFSVKTKTCGWD